MTAPEFVGWPKTPRLFRDVVVTEKLDGTNAAIGIVPATDPPIGAVVYAQSRKRIITPIDDNFGFARWVNDNAETLAADLGAGLHFGEWWGQGIQRGYGLDHKRFSLFNTRKWADTEFTTAGLYTVPVLDVHTLDTQRIEYLLDDLRESGSQAAPGFDNPEGVCIYHAASGQVFKALLDNDDVPKSVAEKVPHLAAVQQSMERRAA